MAILLDPARCTACGSCAAICPSGALVLEGDVLHYDPDGCIDCGVCKDECEHGAIQDGE